MAPTAADIPSKYDVIINGVGYPKDRTQEPWAQHGYSPTFVQRTNVEGDYGDSQQEFWLRWTQRDWTGGEQQRFSRSSGASRYWRGTNIDIVTPGQVTLRNSTPSVNFTATVLASAPRANQNVSTRVVALGTTNLFEIEYDGVVSDRGAHGLGAAPSNFGIATDGGGDVYMTTTAAGTVGVRKWTGSAFSTFSATAADSLAFLNNTLYGLRISAAGHSLLRYDTAGIATVIYSWAQADGGIGPYLFAHRLTAYGSKLAMAWFGMNAEVWLYDGGAAPTLLAPFPRNFQIWDLCEVYGILFISGVVIESSTAARPTIFYFQNGQLGLLWKADSTATFGGGVAAYTLSPALCNYNGGLAFSDDTTGRLMYYDVSRGGIHSFGSYTVAGGPSQLASSIYSLVHTRSQSTGYYFPNTTTLATSGTVTSSLIDFDSSLTKIFRGISVEYTDGTGGDGGSVDIAYRLSDIDGSYTTLQTDATSGTEYALSNITGRAISVQVTINKGTATTSPVLKRVALRAAPRLVPFRQATYALDCTGRDGVNPRLLNDGTLQPLDGKDLADNLRTAATNSTPITIIDGFGSYTGIITEGFRLDELDNLEYRALVPIREI